MVMCATTILSSNKLTLILFSISHYNFMLDAHCTCRRRKWTGKKKERKKPLYKLCMWIDIVWNMNFVQGSEKNVEENIKYQHKKSENSFSWMLKSMNNNWTTTHSYYAYETKNL